MLRLLLNWVGVSAAIIVEMKSDSLDLLEKSQLPPAQARAILKVMESEFATHDRALATKSDFHGLELRLEGLRAETRTEMQILRTEMQTMRAELIGEIKGTVRWNFAFLVTLLAALAAVLKLLK